MIDMGHTLDLIFTQRTEGISSIFTSYRDLYDIYIGALRTLKANQNTLKAIENAENTVSARQKKISNQLYAQGFILLTGAAEALLKDVFVCLLKENFGHFSAPSSINFSAKEVQQILNDAVDADKAVELISAGLGDLTVKKLYLTRNPIEKINFQNVETTKQVLDDHFGLKLIDSDYTKHIHKHWQVRHALIHNNGTIDERYVNNVEKVGLLSKGEAVGYSIKITKKLYDDANEDFLKLFNELDQLIEGTSLNCSIRIPSGSNLTSQESESVDP